MYRIDINDAYPTSAEVYSHELNDGKILTIGFYENDEALVLTGATVTATIVCNKALVAEDVSVSLNQSSTNAVDFNVCSTNNYTIRPGVMLVEFKISKNSKLMYPVVPMIINITPSIRNDAQVTPESYGTVSEILQEVAEARGDFNSLGERLDDFDDKFPVDTVNIKDSAVTTDKISGSAVTTSKIYANAVTENKLANGSVTTDKIAVHAVTSDRIGNEEVKTVNIKDGAVGENKIANGAVNSNKIYTGAVTEAKLDTGAVTENKIANNSVTYAKLSSELQGTIDGKADLTDLDEFIRYSPHTINAASELNVSGYASEYGKYGLKLVGSVANSFEVPSGTLAEMSVIGVGEATVQNPFIRVITFPEFEGVTWYQEVTSNGRQFAADSWIKVDVRNDVVLNPDYSIGFASDGTVITRANTTDIGVGSGIGNSNVRSIYVASKVTSISSSIISATIGLTTDTLDLYVDNTQGNIDIASEILSDSRVTIYYRGDFSVIDLLSNSQKCLNDRLTELETTVGTVNQMLENSLSGVS